MSSSTASSKTQQQQHLEWIHSMNAMAMMANPFDAHQQQQLQGYMHPRTYTASPSGQQQMAHTIHPPQQTYMGPGFTTHMSLSSQPSSHPHSHSHPQHQQQQTRNDNSGNQKAPSTNNNMDHLMPSAEIASAILMNAHPPNRGGYRMTQIPVAETAEKRARRLARNRESARQSRRRKKVLLSSLSDKVNKLHHAIDVERRNQLRSMEGGLRGHRQALIQQLNDTQTTTTQSYIQKPHSEALRTIVHDMGPNCTVRRSAAAFQYSALKQYILPKYQEYLLWLIQNDPSYLTAARDDRTKVRLFTGSI
jgi:LPS O-antigen subunit length determinant protein (WzzB/FepE family)